MLKDLLDDLIIPPLVSILMLIGVLLIASLIAQMWSILPAAHCLCR